MNPYDEVPMDDVAKILRAVQSVSSDNDIQLTALTLALVIACKICFVKKEDAMKNIEMLFDDIDIRVNTT